MSKFLLLLGPSGVGKSAIIDELSKLDSRFVYISPYMTRPLRVGERNKVAISDKQMDKMWARGELLSVGVRPTGEPAARVGLRTRRGMKGAAIRNRLKRQLRAILFSKSLPWRQGVDVVVVIHPERLPARSASLEQELLTLCRRTNVIS